MARLEERFERPHGDAESARSELERLAATAKEVVVVSACLVGVHCRHDGDHREKKGRLAALGDVEILPLCPEMLAGFGVPRPTLTLSLDGKTVIDKDGRDVTAALRAGVQTAAGYAETCQAKRALLKERSPSCGVAAVHSETGLRAGEGFFTAELKRRRLRVVSDED